MKIDSKVLAVALERIGSVLSLQKFVTNEDYRRVRFVVKDDELVLTATDGYLIAKIWTPMMSEGEAFDALVDTRRLAPFTKYIDGEMSLRPRKASILASCGAAQCPAEISSGFLPSISDSEVTGKITLTKKQLGVLMSVLDNYAGKEIEKNINLLGDTHNCAATFQEVGMACTIAQAHEGTFPDLLPPKYVQCAMRIAGEETVTLDLSPPLVRMETKDAVVVFPSVPGPPASAVFADKGAYAEPTHAFSSDDVAPAIIAMNEVRRGDDWIWAELEQQEDESFLLKHKDSDLVASLAFNAELASGEWYESAIFNARKMLLAVKATAGGKLHVIPHSDGVHCILVFVNDPIRILVGPGGQR